MKKIIYTILALAVILMSDSCQRELASFSYESDCAGVTFLSATPKFIMVAEDGNKIVANLYRGNVKGAISIPVNITDYTEGVFVAEKSSFDFKDGENTASITFNYPSIDDFAAEVYNIDIEIAEEALGQVAFSGNSKASISAQRKLTPVSLGEATVTSAWWEQTYTAPISNTVEASNYYTIEDCYDNGYDFSFTVNSDGTVSVADQAVYFYEGYGDTYIINASGTIEGKTITISGDWYLAAIDWNFGTLTDTIVLP